MKIWTENLIFFFSLSSSNGPCSELAIIYTQFNKQLTAMGGGPIISLFHQKLKDIPSCDNKGFFQPFQCNRRRTTCWCADAFGKEIPRTRDYLRDMFNLNHLQMSCQVLTDYFKNELMFFKETQWTISSSDSPVFSRVSRTASSSAKIIWQQLRTFYRHIFELLRQFYRRKTQARLILNHHLWT